MSTRRARIKAVAALPPRRKNVDNAAKEGFEKGVKSVLNVKSPRTPRSQKTEEKGSPAVKNLRSPPELLPLAQPQVSESVSKTPVPDKASPSPHTPKERSSTPKSKKVSVITSAVSIKGLPATPLCPLAQTATTENDKPATPTPTTVNEKETQSVPDGSIKNKPSVTDQINNKVPSTPSTYKKNDNIPDDYSVPSVPESVSSQTEGDVMDGIVPLKTASSAPKPIDLLKNEIISEYAEVAFDPIVPLPSPSKVRPKIRPVPRLAPYRRNSVQGSASESEDESRRALLGGSAAPAAPAPPRQRHDSHSTMHSVSNREINRVRNDSVCSGVSQIAAPQPPVATSPVKEKHVSKSRRQEVSRRSWVRRRETKREAITMYDLIFYNPTENPIIPDEDEVKAKAANAKEEAERISKPPESEEDADDPPAGDAAPVPQIKLGPNGEIILDEKSLVIKQSDNRKVSSVVREGAWGSGGGRYKRSARTAEWSAAETVRFYRALAALGTDFTLMAPLFPGRSRKDLYLKFKKEERLNGGQVDKALRSAMTWDADALKDEFTQEREDAAKRAEEERRRYLENKKAERERMKVAREMRVRNSKGAKALESTMIPGVTNPEMTADYFVKRAIQARAHALKKKKDEKLSQEESTTKKPESNMQPPPPFATLTLLGNNKASQNNRQEPSDMATISKVDSNAQSKHINMNEVVGAPSNIENGSLVVLRVSDPSSPGKTMLQTYIARGDGKLTPVALPPTFLNSVVGYMKKGTPKSTMSSASSPQLTSPSSVASQDSRSCTPGVIQLNPSPAKRQRHSSYTITPL